MPSTHWSAIANDPMDAKVIDRRRAVVDAARRPPVTDRTAFLCDLARGKRLLDIGVVDHSLGSARSADWLHGRLAEVAEDSLGVDVLPEPIKCLRDRGYKVECLDVTIGGRPEGRFDVIVAGEVIEHLGNVGGLFDAASDLLSENGTFVITTPNPFAAWRVYQHLRGKPYENVDHVTYLSAWGIAELAERAGLHLRSFRGIAPQHLVGRKAQVFAWAVRRRLLPLVPESVTESIIYEIERSSTRSDRGASAS